jgi:hypothetical protein
MGFGVGTVRTQVSIAVIFMVRRCYNGPVLAATPGRQERKMKTMLILAASLALGLAGCNRDTNAPAGATKQDPSSSAETPKGGATGQKSEGSTDDRKAPDRPASK